MLEPFGDLCSYWEKVMKIFRQSIHWRNWYAVMVCWYASSWIIAFSIFFNVSSLLLKTVQLNYFNYHTLTVTLFIYYFIDCKKQWRMLQSRIMIVKHLKPFKLILFQRPDVNFLESSGSSSLVYSLLIGQDFLPLVEHGIKFQHRLWTYFFLQ